MKKMFTISLFSLMLITIFIVLVFIILINILQNIRSKTKEKNKVQINKSLGETLKHYRTSNKVIQEYVAEVVGVSRQAVSKWENNVFDQSTSNLINLAELYNISVEDLLKMIKALLDPIGLLN